MLLKNAHMEIEKQENERMFKSNNQQSKLNLRKEFNQEPLLF